MNCDKEDCHDHSHGKDYCQKNTMHHCMVLPRVFFHGEEIGARDDLLAEFI